jgi:hypothetical protein
MKFSTGSQYILQVLNICLIAWVSLVMTGQSKMPITKGKKVELWGSPKLFNESHNILTSMYKSIIATCSIR